MANPKPVTIKFNKNEIKEVVVRTCFRYSKRYVPLVVDSVIECLPKRVLIENLGALGVVLTASDKLHKSTLVLKFTDALLKGSNGLTAGITITITPPPSKPKRRGANK